VRVGRGLVVQRYHQKREGKGAPRNSEKGKMIGLKTQRMGGKTNNWRQTRERTRTKVRIKAKKKNQWQGTPVPNKKRLTGRGKDSEGPLMHKKTGDKVPWENCTREIGGKGQHKGQPDER